MNGIEDGIMRKAALGMKLRTWENIYIKLRTTRLNGKLERFHRTDEVEFCQLLTYKDDVDLSEKLAV